MAAPTDADLPAYGTADGVPLNDTDPIGGAIDLGNELLSGSFGNTIAELSIDTVSQSFRGIFYRKNISAGSLQNARMYNRAGMQFNSSSGAAQIISTSTLDGSSLKVKLTGYVSSVLTTEELTLNGMVPVNGGTLWDSSGLIACEVLSTGNTPTTPTGNLTLSVASEIVGIVYGVAENSALALNAITTFYTFALASTKSTTISSTNRKTDPASGIGSFYNATKWAGNDQSVPIPTGTLGASEYIGICIKVTVPASYPSPLSAYFRFADVLVGNPVA